MIAYIGGLTLSAFLTLGAAAAACAAAPPRAAMAMAFMRKGKGATAILMLTFLLLGLLAGSLRLLSLADSRLEQQLGKWITAEVQVEKPPKVSNGSMSFMARATSGMRRQQQLYLDEAVLVRIGCGERCDSLEAMSLEEGSRLRLQGTVSEVRYEPKKDFDYGLYLKRRGVNVELAADVSRVELLNGVRGGFSGMIDTLRRHARASLGTGDWGDASGLFQGMVIGDTRGIGDGVISDFRDSGLLHLLAVSGQNVVLLGFVVAAFCRALFIPRRSAAVSAALVIIFYVPLTGADASIMRAGAVGLLGLAAELLSRQADRYHFLALAAAVIMTVNPNAVFDPGFQLSFAAVLSIFLVAPAITARMRWLPELLREPICISAAAGLATAPITLFHFHQVPLVTVPANVAAAPVAGPVMLLGVSTIAVAPLSAALNWMINSIACLCTGYLVVISHLFSSVPGGVYRGEAPGFFQVSAFYGLLAALVLLCERPGHVFRLLRFAGARPAATAAVAILLLVPLAVTWQHEDGTPPSAFTASFLDVGQGDATLLQDPQGATVLIDGGPGSQVLDKLRASGVSRLDAVILTHPHADHYAGLDEVLGSYDVAAFYDSGVSQAEAEADGEPGGGDDYLRLMRQLDDRHIAPQVLRRGQRLEFGGLELAVYHPGDWLRPDNTNANSLVIVASYAGLDILLPGDAEGEVLTTLDLPQVDIYKAPHHGSRDLYLGTVLADLEPGCAVISVGEGNDYGHPSQSTLDSLARAGTPIFRTDTQGTVRITAAGGCEGATTGK